MDHGWNFRASAAPAGYPGDDADETYDLGEAYPVTRDGFTFGWSGDLTGSARDRSLTPDHRLFGFIQNEGGTQSWWRLDLDATGDFTWHLAMGDQSFGLSNAFWIVTDDGSALETVDHNASIAAADYIDATETVYAYGDWPGSETASGPATWGTTIFKLYVGQASPGRFFKLNHVRVVTDGGSPPATPAAVPGGRIPLALGIH